MTKLAAWKARAIHELELPSGTHISFRMPNQLEVVRGAQVPLTLMAKIEEATKGDKDTGLPPDVYDSLIRFHDHMVACAVVAVEGEAAQLTPEDAAALPQEDYAEIRDYATREKALPKPKD